MIRAEAAQKAAPFVPALLLLLAAAAGGLRSPAAWLGFACLFLGWTLLRRPGLRGAEQAGAALFLAWYAVAALFSPDLSRSLPAFARQALPVLFFFYAASCDEGERWWLPSVYVLGVAGTIAMLCHQVCPSWPPGFIGRNPNYSAAFCAAGFAPALLALAGGGSRKEKIIYGALVLALAAGLAVSESRGAALAAFLTAVAGLGYSRRWRWLGGLCLAALGAAALLPSSAWEGLLKTYDPRAFARPHLWYSAAEAAAASPLLGWGPGRFADVFELFKFPFFNGVSYYGHYTLHAHSEVLNLAAEAGLPAAAFFLLASARGLAAGAVKKLPLALCALSVFIQASVDIVLYSGAVSLLFWGSLGFAVSVGEPARAPSKAPAALAALCLACLLACFAPSALSGRWSAARAKSAAGSGNPAVELAAARTAAQAAPKNPFHAAREGAVLVFLGDRAGAEAAYGRAAALEPCFAAARLELARLLAAGGRYGEACAALDFPEVSPDPGNIQYGYQRGIMDHDREAAALLVKRICGKKKTGTAIAACRRLYSKTTK